MMPPYSDYNGCTCAATRSLAVSSEGSRVPMAANWRCTSCVGRAQLPIKCRLCGVGIYPDEVAFERLCANCQIEQGYP